MLFPIRTERRVTRSPWMNYSLIIANVAVFLLLQEQALFILLGQAGVIGPNVRFDSSVFTLWSDHPQVFQFFSYQFLHGGWLHLIFNMLFLWVFGNAVEDRLGKATYLGFYLAGGVLAGLGHVLTEPLPVLGASGSVAGVTGAYLALFPLARVTVVVWFFIITFLELPSLLVILFYVGWNVFSQFLGGGGNVAYTAHLAGYLYGFALGMGLLLSRLLSREPYDMLSLIEQKRRQAKFRRATRSGESPWQGQIGEPGGEPAPAPTAEEQALMERRQEINRALQQGRSSDAGALYAQLLEEHPDQVMSEQQQLDLANQLMSEGRYQAAAAAYELFLRHYPAHRHVQQVRLILGLIYARYLGRKERARELLGQAVDQLQGEDQALARQVMTEIGA
jgi:membrane associated rhomboid family serine protease